VKNTFGRTIAAHKLEMLLEENPSARRKVSRLLSSYTNNLWNVIGVKSSDTILMCIDLIREQTLKRVDKIQNLTPEIRSYTKNVVTCRYRVYRQCFENRIMPVLNEMMAMMVQEKKDLTSETKEV